MKGMKQQNKILSDSSEVDLKHCTADQEAERNHSSHHQTFPIKT